jgi:hypothetical protein
MKIQVIYLFQSVFSTKDLFLVYAVDRDVDGENVDPPSIESWNISIPVADSDDNANVSVVEENGPSTQPKFESPLRIRHHVKSAVEHFFKPTDKVKIADNLVEDESSESMSKKTENAVEEYDAAHSTDGASLQVDEFLLTKSVEEHETEIELTPSEAVEELEKYADQPILAAVNLASESKEASQQVDTQDAHVNEITDGIAPLVTAEETVVDPESLADSIKDISPVIDVDSSIKLSPSEENQAEDVPISPSQSSVSESLFGIKRRISLTINQLFKSDRSNNSASLESEAPNESIDVINVAQQSRSIPDAEAAEVCAIDEADGKELEEGHHHAPDSSNSSDSALTESSIVVELAENYSGS